MSIENINVETAIENVRNQIKEEKMSPAMQSALEVILLLVSILIKRTGLNSKNSSKPPSQDPNRKKDKKKGSNKKQGGQKGHEGSTLKQTDTPDEIVDLTINQSTLPQGKYLEAGHESRQVFDVDISVHVTEYRAQILKNEQGEKFIAQFPKDINSSVQYGNGIKSQSVYLSQFQLLPYDRTAEYFADQLHLPLSTGTINNYNQKAYELLEPFEKFLKEKLQKSFLNHADETGININGKRHWLHGLSNEKWTLLSSHRKRGKEAMDDIDVLPHYQGILCHDHWKPYFKYENITHSLCNAHHLRELESAFELSNQQWAKKMQDLLIEMKKAKEYANGELQLHEVEWWKKKYQKLLKEADKECPPPKEEWHPTGFKKKRGRKKRTKERNLLERLRDFEVETLRFLDHKDVPFTNNLGERDIRMTKVHQKISGCFRSEEGSKIFCRIRSYLSSAKKQNISASYALRALFEGRDIFSEGGC